MKIDFQFSKIVEEIPVRSLYFQESFYAYACLLQNAVQCPSCNFRMVWNDDNMRAIGIF